MKILVIHNHYQLPGGEDSVVASELKLLKQFGHDVVFYERSNKEFKSFSFWKKIKFLLTDFFWSNANYHDIKNICAKERPDIAHFHNIYFMTSPSVYKACRDSGVKVVQTVHNFRMLCPNGLFYRNNRICELCHQRNLFYALKYKCWRSSFSQTVFSVLFILFCRLFKVHDKYVNSFIALSNFSKSKFVEAGIKSDKIFVKPNFIEYLPGSRNSIGDYVLYIGALSDYKGVWDFVEAASFLPNIEFRLIGSGPLSNEIEQYSGRKNLENIKLLGQMKSEDVIEMIKNSAFVVIPSKCYENFPRVLVEAFACGVPVLAPKTPVFNELLSGHDKWLYDGLGEMVERIKCLMADKESLLQEGERVYNVFTQKYTAEKQKEYFESIYNLKDSV